MTRLPFGPFGLALSVGLGTARGVEAACWMAGRATGTGWGGADGSER
jgi:hypothetical protein